MIEARLPRHVRLWGAVVVVGVGGALLLNALRSAGVLSQTAMPAVLLALLMGVLVLCRPAWLAMDEAAREAHKSAFYWGGCVGMAFAGAVVAGLCGAGCVGVSALVAPWAAPGTQAVGMAAGVLLTLLLVLAGYTAAWGLWWLRRR